MKFRDLVDRDAVVPHYDHIIVMFEENKGYSTVLDRGYAPAISNLAKKYGVATQLYAERHPSEPNYVNANHGPRGATDATAYKHYSLLPLQPAADGRRCVPARRPRAPCGRWGGSSDVAAVYGPAVTVSESGSVTSTTAPPVDALLNAIEPA